MVKSKGVFVEQLKPNSDVDTIFIINEKEVRLTKTGSQFISLRLSDRTGSIDAKIWDSSGVDLNAVPDKGPVRVAGRIELYKDTLQIIVSSIEPVDSRQLKEEDFLPSIDADKKDELWRDIKAFYNELTCRWCRKLWFAFMRDHNFKDLKEKFGKSPAAVKVHHAYLGGLLEHTVSVLKLVKSICNNYDGLDRNLLYTGALLHDVGKIREYVYDDWFFDLSDEGRLLGHIVLGVQIVQELIRSVKGFPEEKATLILHLILSHHGQFEYGTARLPMTKEAVALHFADILDARMKELERIYDETTEGERWTSYQNKYGTRFLLPLFSEVGEGAEFDEALSQATAEGPPEIRQLSFEAILARTGSKK